VAKESDKDDIGTVSIGNDFMELDAQTKLEGHFAFLAEDLFFDKDLEENTNWEDCFLTDNGNSAVVSDNSLKESDNNNKMDIV
ncbi:hypothetical protein MMC31_006747, partial [Peltigera leucophlebia]|nr:hypothetical protein [Peltigera leucophlebia]